MTIETNPLLEYDRSDAEDCQACIELEASCPYHVGVGDGIEWMAGRLRKIAEDPDILTSILLDLDEDPLAAYNPGGGVRS